MATEKYLIDENWQQVSNAAALVEVPEKCKHVLITTGNQPPAPDTEAFHTIAGSEARTFSYGGVDNIYVRKPDDTENTYVIVTGDDLV